MEIPLVDLRKQYAPLKTEILSGIERALDGMHLFLGENVQALEREFAQFCGARHGIGVSDGITFNEFTEDPPGDESQWPFPVFVWGAEDKLANDTQYPDQHYFCGDCCCVSRDQVIFRENKRPAIPAVYFGILLCR